MDKTNPIKIMLVDDHAMVRSGLRLFLMAFSDLNLIAEASGGEEAVTLCRQSAPDVVLMDMVMPGMDGAEATRAIKTCNPNIQVIALTSFREGDLVERALKAGAISFLLKNVSATDLAAAIRAAHAGRSTLAPEAAQALVQTTVKKQAPSFKLTERQKDVLALMVKGYSNEKIAEHLVISISTVKFHARAIYTELNAANRAEAVALALQHHLVE